MPKPRKPPEQTGKLPGNFDKDSAYYNCAAQGPKKEIILYSNGDKYEGTILDGDLHGEGTYYYKNSDVYKGEWYLHIRKHLENYSHRKRNKKHGWGTHYYIKTGKRYVGQNIKLR